MKLTPEQEKEFNLNSRPKPYEWYSQIGSKDWSELKPKTRVIYENPTPDWSSEFDNPFFKEFRRIIIPTIVYYISPRGFIKISPSDGFWIDPRDRERLIQDGFIIEINNYGEISFGGTYFRSCRCVLDIIPDKLPDEKP